MEAFGSYLLKSAVWLTGFSIVYLLFLRNERFFRLKRIYLISGILVSFLFPLITVHYQVELPASVTSSAVPVNASDQTNLPVQQISVTGVINYRNIIAGLYIAGIIFLVFRSIWHFWHLFKSIRNSKINNRGPAKLIRASEYPSSFSFFNYIFVNPSVNETEVEEIMNHELVHVNQKHWLDLMLGEILRLIQWANPFAWIYTGFIRLNHEYLADEVALQRTADPALYKATLLNQMFRSPVFSLSNSFNYSLNKKRFDMMKKIITSPYRKFKALFVLPVFAIVFYAFATPEYHYITPVTDPLTIYQAPAIIQKVVKGTVLKEDGKPFNGVFIESTGTAGNVRAATTGQDGRFSITDVKDDALLLFNYKGFKQVALKPDYNSDMVVKMEIDPEYPDKAAVIRGINDSQVKPLIIVDGVVKADGMEGINPNNIQSLKVIKNESTTAAYGEKGKNGVILITTGKSDQHQVYGVVQKEDGKPLERVDVTTTGSMGNARFMTTGSDGRFSFDYIQSDAVLMFSCPGYKRLTLKPDFTKEMTVKMEKDPDYKAPEGSPQAQFQRPTYIVTIDGVLTDKTPEEARKELGYNFGIMSISRSRRPPGDISPKDTVKIITRKKALEMGLKPPFPRLAPEDYPTFQGQRYSAFQDWFVSQVKYPAEASEQKIEGWVSVNFKVQLDGTLTEIQSTIPVSTILSNEVISAIKSAPKWEPPKNPNVDEPFTQSVTMKFKLPDQVIMEAPFVVVEEMPRYPGGDAELLKYIAMNTNYPETAKLEKIEGRVILRFVVSKEGRTEAISVLKGVHPLLDAEAIRVASTISGWTPGKQGGIPVNVWYMVPITFILTPPEQPK